jgi:hypothetical protein
MWTSSVPSGRPGSGRSSSAMGEYALMARIGSSHRNDREPQSSCRTTFAGTLAGGRDRATRPVQASLTSDPALLRAILMVRDGAGGDYWKCGTCECSGQVPHYAAAQVGVLPAARCGRDDGPVRLPRLNRRGGGMDCSGSRPRPLLSIGPDEAARVSGRAERPPRALTPRSLTRGSTCRSRGRSTGRSRR